MRPVMEWGGWERKQARDAPAGPAPTMRRGTSTTMAVAEEPPLVEAESILLCYKL